MTKSYRYLPLSWWGLLALLLLLGCRSEPGPTPTFAPTLTPAPPSAIPPTATMTLTPSATPLPTATPTSTPTPTPLPIRLSVEVPTPMTALEPVPIRVRVEEPEGVSSHLSLRARVIDAQDRVYARFDLSPEGRDGWWVAKEGLQLPLEPEPHPGVWHLIIDVQADWPVEGYRHRVFIPQRVPYHILSGTLPSGVVLGVPQAFASTVSQGNTLAGFQAWRYQDCEVTLAWAPGPTEPLLADNAWVIEEATYDPAYEITVEDVIEAPWGEEARNAFLFVERWAKEDRTTPAQTYVVQGPSYQLFALRVRALEESEIHPVCRDVQKTIDFVEN